MSISTRSKFYYGHTISLSNASLDFKEGAGPELQATLNIGNYTLTEFVDEVKRALDSAGDYTYDVALDRATRKITISSADGNFSILCTSGSRVGTTGWGLVGFTGADKTGDDEYEGQVGSGFEFKPQRLLFDYVGPDDDVEKTDAVVNQSASGRVQVTTFGTTRFIDMNIRDQSNKAIPSYQQGTIEQDLAGLTNLRAFMAYAITKAKMEFMPDRDTESSFYPVLLESTSANRSGTAYKLKEREGGAGFWSSDRLTWRVIE